MRTWEACDRCIWSGADLRTRRLRRRPHDDAAPAAVTLAMVFAGRCAAAPLGAIVGASIGLGGLAIVGLGALPGDASWRSSTPTSTDRARGGSCGSPQIGMSGGVFGTGPGLASKWGFPPEAHTDFILAVIGEEPGLVGSLIIARAVCRAHGAGCAIRDARARTRFHPTGRLRHHDLDRGSRPSSTSASPSEPCRPRASPPRSCPTAGRRAGMSLVGVGIAAVGRPGGLTVSAAPRRGRSSPAAGPPDTLPVWRSHGAVDLRASPRDPALRRGERGIESRLVPEAGFAITLLPGRGLQRRSPCRTWLPPSARPPSRSPGRSS